MAISQKQIRNSYTVTVIAAALVGRDKEVTYIEELNGNFHYVVDALLVDDGATIIPALGTNAHWVLVGSAASGVQNNFTAIVAPAPINDSAAGFSAGSQWLDTVTGKSYICTSAAVGAAAWAVTDYVDAPHNYAAIIAPSPTDDITAGYTVGSKWLDTVAENMYVCVNHTAGAAVWHQTDQVLTPGVVTTLDYVYLYDSSAAHAANVNIPLTTFNIVDDVSGLVSVAGITIAKAGRYEIIYTSGTAKSGVNSNSIKLMIDGVSVTQTSTAGIAAGNQVPNALSYQAVLTVGQIINIQANTAPIIGDIQLSVKQLPVETIVPAGSAKANFTATVAPAITDSTANGYALGSQWVDTVANASYICVDATAGAAVWELSSGLTPYSTTERLTDRTWINGKPIYESVINHIGFISGAATIPHGIVGITEILPTSSIILRKATTGLISGGTNAAAFDTDISLTVIHVNSPNTALQNGFLAILYYTK